MEIDWPIFAAPFEFTIHATPVGNEVVVSFDVTGLSVGEQGARLMELEDAWREQTGVPVELYFEPMQDRNAIRRFRGVKVS